MQNQAVNIDTLPSIQNLEKQPLAQHYPLTKLLTSSVFFGTLILVTLVANYQSIIDLDDGLRRFLTYLPYVFLGLGGFYSTYQWFADKVKAYSLREHDISFFSGLLFRKLVTQPTSRIQHVEVSQGPIERLAKLGNLQVYSAGSSMQTFTIPGLPIDIAHQLRQQLTSSVNQDAPQDPSTSAQQ